MLQHLEALKLCQEENGPEPAVRALHPVKKMYKLEPETIEHVKTIALGFNSTESAIVGESFAVVHSHHDRASTPAHRLMKTIASDRRGIPQANQPGVHDTNVRHRPGLRRILMASVNAPVTRDVRSLLACSDEHVIRSLYKFTHSQT